MRKLTAIMCAILIFSTAIIPVNAEVAVYSEPGQTVSVVETDNAESDNIGIDSIESDNTEFVDELEGAVESDGAGEPVVLAETSETVGDFTISGDDLNGNDYSYADGVLTVLGSTPITISTPNNDADNPTTDRIVVDSQSGANITLSDVQIDARTNSAPAFEIMAGSGSVTVILEGNNTLTSGTGGVTGFEGWAGLQNNCVPVTITGSGNLTATGGTYGGAGIGGGRYGDGKDITIGKSETTDVEFSGTITANGSELNASGAGIGGGSGGSGTNIKISGSGTVNATGGRDGGAGIGGGEDGNIGCSGTNITISMNDNGKVTANGKGGGAGIGGGKGGNGEKITINGSGIVEANSTIYGGGAGIGGGQNGGCGIDITISGSVRVTATGCSNGGGAGIGGGQGGDGEKITISGNAIVEAKGGDGGAGIGGGSGYGYVFHDWNTGENTEYNYNANNGKNIIIDENFSGQVIAEGSNGGAGIGGGSGYAYYSYDTGKGYTVNGGNGENINITISRGTVTATGGGDGNGKGGGAGIGGGGGYNYNYGYPASDGKYYKANAGDGKDINITISGGTVTATGSGYGGSGGAGIGGGSYYDYNDYTTNGGNGEHINITISGGTVTATGSPSGGGAGIGGGKGGGIGNDINISGSGGTVTATGGSSGGAGIGGGSGGAGGADEDGKGIKISGDVTVKATGGDGGAGIGGGKNGDGSNITIDCKTIDNEDTTGNEQFYKIIATGGSGGAGIGGGGGDLNGSGAGGNGSNINIYGGNIKAKADGNSNCGAGIGGGRAGNGSNITITAGKVFAEGGGGAGIGGGSGFIGIGGAGTDIKIKGGVITATGGSVGGGAGIGGGERGEADNIQISGGKIIATAWVGAGIGIGGSLNSESDNRRIQISGNAYVEAESNNSAGIGGKLAVVTIQDSATVKARGNKDAAIGGKDSTVEIKGGNVTATGKSIGIGGENSSVKINGTSSKSFPWVFTNKIERGNVSDKYSSCIVFEEAYKNSFNDEVFGNEYAPDGVVYGDVDLSDLTEAYTLESDKLLRVQDGTEEKVTFKTAKKLILKGTLYIAESATPDKYYNVVIEDGRILHEDESNYVEENSGEWICDICGKEEPHNWEDWQKNRTHHWHECTGVNDCSVNENPIEKCSITDFSTVSESEYGEHIFRKLDNTRSIIVTYECEVCKYRYSTVIPEISIYKVDEGGDPLIGAKFGLYSDEDCTQQVGDEVTAAEVWVNGEKKAAAVFNAEIEFDKSYYIKETKAPDGYKKSDTVYTVKVTVVSDESDEPIDGKVIYGTVGSETTSENIRVCENTKIIPDPIQIYKEDGNGKALTGAKFELYSDAGCTAQVGDEVTATEVTVGDEIKAIASFTVGIELDKTYYIKETAAPAGYRKSDDVFKAVVDKDGKVTYGVVGSESTSENIPVCKNSKIVITPGPVQITKVDGEGKALEGAEFGLYSDPDCQNPVAGKITATSDKNGKVSFTEGIEPGNTYYIMETKAPSGYMISEEVFKAVVAADGKVTYGADNSTDIPVCKNIKIVITPGPAKIIKVDGETGAPLAGARFGIYSDKQCTEANRIATGTTRIDTDSASDTYKKAVVSFKTELSKTYYIKELKAPDGYKVSDKVYKAVVDKDGQVTYGAAGSETTSKTVPVCKNSKIVITPGPAKIIKVDGETGAPLAGAKFGIYSDEQCTEANRIATGTTRIDTDSASDTYKKAVVSFKTELSKTYYIKELKAPDGYKVSDKVYKAVVDKDGKVTYGTAGSETTSKTVPVCKNYAVKSASAKIIKVDGETGAPLAGARFGIYSDKQCTEANRIATGTTRIDTDNASNTYNKAVVSFATEPNRTYYIKEIAAPDGYKVSDEVYKAVVDADGKVTYGAAGSEATTKTVPVCKNYVVETGVPYAVSPKTGDAGGFGIAGMAILSGIICAASFVAGGQKRKSFL